MIFRIMWTGFGRRHSITLFAVKRDVDFQRFRKQCTIPQFIENVMCIERAVIIAYAGMVATDDQVRATEILPDKRMKQRFSRTRIAHLDRITGLHNRPRPEVIINHRLYGLGANLGRDVAGFQFSST